MPAGRKVKAGGRRAFTNPFPSLVGVQEAADYEAVRPGYPAAAYNVILRDARHAGAPVRKAVDVGAGTGQFTRGLLGRGVDVWAVEPAEAMREQLTRSLFQSGPQEGLKTAGKMLDQQQGSHGSLQISGGLAENTGLPEGFADLVVWAQCSHWLDPAAASEEAARILKPQGTLAVVVNQLDVRVPWVHRLSRIMRSGDVARADRPPKLGSFFTAPKFSAVEWSQPLTVDECLRLARTRSSYLAASPSQKEKMQKNLSWHLLDHLAFDPKEPFLLPYTTLIWTAHT